MNNPQDEFLLKQGHESLNDYQELWLNNSSGGKNYSECWKIMVVDDNTEIHQLIRWSLEDFTFEGKPLTIISAFSGAEAKQLIADNPDIACILLDVMMETRNAGLQLVKYLRQELKNQLVRIIIQTAYTVEAPETLVILNYDINDYKTKMELSDPKKLVATIILALRSYRELQLVKASLESSEQLANILVVDDDQIYLEFLLAILSEFGYHVQSASNGKQAIKFAKLTRPDIILLDIKIPEFDGYQICQVLKADKQTSHIPIIFLSVLNDTVDKVKAFKVGGIDYITKPFQPEEIKARLDVHLANQRLRKQLEEQNLRLQQEITIRTTIEERLRIVERAISASSDGIIITDAQLSDRPIIYVNSGFERITGYSAAEVIGNNFDFLLQDNENEPAIARLSVAIAEGKESQATWQNLRKDGANFWNELKIWPVYNSIGNVTHFIGVLQDITKRKEAELELQQAYDAADIANRAKSAFLANMSHELRTPLNAILGFAQILGRDSYLTPQQQENISIINRSGEHLLSLISDVLNLSKIEAGRIDIEEVDFNLKEILLDLKDMFLLKANQKGLELKLVLAADLPEYVKADRIKLRQVLINLLSNAIKFTTAGSVTLRVRRIFSADPACHLLFEVEDTGIGINREEIDTIFQPFVQTKSRRDGVREGTGLGLTISKRHAQLLGGDITVTSQPGNGSTFTLSLKLARADRVPCTPQPETRHVLTLAPNQPQYRILVADDEESNRSLLVQLLTSLGFDVKSAVNGSEAIAIWQSFHPHLILMDMQMPALDGYEASRQIKATAIGKATIIIAVTANALKSDKTVILSTECNDIVYKPFKEEVLLEKIAQYLGVCFTYKENIFNDDSADSDSDIVVNLSALQQVLPPTWINDLEQAALALNDEELYSLISLIPSQGSAVTSVLFTYISNFEYDKIVDAIARIKQNNG